MKIRIEHTSNPLNYGTNMMVTNFMFYIDKYMKVKNEYELDVYNDKDLEKYKLQYKEGNMSRKTIDYNLCYSTNIIGKIANKIKRDLFSNYYTKRNLKKLCEGTETLVVLGGDDLSEYYGVKPLEKELYRINYIKEKINLYLVGQTIGPFTESRIDKSRKSMESVNIYSRDPWTTKYLNSNLALDKIIDSRDLALLPLPYQEDKTIEDNILERYNLTENEYITIVPSGLYKSYCNDIDVYINNWQGIINYIKNKYPTKKIVLLPHVLRSSEVDDRNIIKEIQKRMGCVADYIYDELTPLQARFILGNGVLTITGRMHGAISTLQMKKPAISISYSVKYNGVIGEGLGLSDLIVNGEKNEFWQNRKVENDVIEKIEYVMCDYNKILKKLSKGICDSEEKVKLMITDISTNLLKNNN